VSDISADKLHNGTFAYYPPFKITVCIVRVSESMRLWFVRDIWRYTNVVWL